MKKLAKVKPEAEPTVPFGTHEDGFSTPFRLPLEYVTAKLAWLGKTGSGKTYGAKKFVEGVFHAGAQVVVFDTVGVWYGLRVPGKGDGLPIPVFGGLYGDVPFGNEDGARLAELVFVRRLSCVIDVSPMLDAEMHRFAGDFFERYFELQKAHPRAVHFVLEEAHLLIPQERNEVPSRTMNRVMRVCTVGRNFGMGVSIVSQRPQAVSKRCLNQTGVLFAFKTVGAHERDAISRWFSSHDMNVNLSVELPKLARGSAIVFDADADGGVPRWVVVGEIDSGDTSSTPKVGTDGAPENPWMGQAVAHGTGLKELLDSLRAAFAKPAPAPEPKKLAKESGASNRIAELEAKLELTLRQRGGLLEALQQTGDALRAIEGELGKLLARINEDVESISFVSNLVPEEPAHDHPRPRRGGGERVNLYVANAELPELTTTRHAELSKLETRIVDALNKHNGTLSRERLSAYLGVHWTSSSFVKPLASLRQKGVVRDYTLVNADAHAVVPPGCERRELYFKILNEREREMYDLIVDGAESREELSRRLGVHWTSSSFVKPLSRLRKLGMIEGYRPAKEFL